MSGILYADPLRLLSTRCTHTHAHAVAGLLWTFGGRGEKCRETETTRANRTDAHASEPPSGMPPWTRRVRYAMEHAARYATTSLDPISSRYRWQSTRFAPLRDGLSSATRPRRNARATRTTGNRRISSAMRLRATSAKSCASLRGATSRVGRFKRWGARPHPR